MTNRPRRKTRSGRRKKRGMALVISYLVRIGMAAVLVLSAALAVFAVRFCVDWAISSRQEPSAEVSGPDLGLEEPEVQQREDALLVLSPVTGVVTVDPGHGGEDPGCGDQGYLEKDIVLNIANRLKEQLESAGVTVIMTRQTDTGVSLDQRAIVANQAGSDLFVSVHCNSFEGQASGLECYYYKAEEGQRLAQAITDAAAGLGVATRQVQKNNYQVLWDTDMTAVLVETGFLSDPQDRAALLTPEHQDRVARAIAQGVADILRTRQAGAA